MRIGVSYGTQRLENWSSHRFRPIAATARWLRRGAGGYQGGGAALRKDRPRIRRQRFPAGPTYPLQSCNDCSNFLVAVGDFNGDGTLDLLESNGLSISTVSLGRGDGTFRTTQLYDYNANLEAYNLVTADFNSDGFPDIAQSISGIASGVYINGKIGINLGSSHGVPGTTSYATASTCTGN